MVNKVPVLVELDPELVHGLHGLVREGDLHVDLVGLAREGARHLQALPLGRLQPRLLRRDVERRGGRAAQAEDVAEEGVGGL